MHQHNNEIYVKIKTKDYFIQAPTQENINAKQQEAYLCNRREMERKGEYNRLKSPFVVFNLYSVQCNRDSNNKRLIL